MTRLRGAGVSSLAALMLSVGTATVASAEPPWQFPWPTDMDTIGHIVFPYLDRDEHAS